MSFELATLPSPPGDGPPVPVAQVRGDIDVTNADALADALADLARPALIIDLSAVRYFDSAGFAALDKLLSRHQVAAVVPPGSVIRAAMSLMNLPFHDTVTAARAALASA